MIAVDTNVLARLFLNDDPDQAALAHEVLAAARKRHEPCLVPDIVLAELVWLLARRYGANRATLAQVIRELLTNDTFVFEDRAAVQETLLRFEREPANLADQLIGTAARRLGARFTLTFDRALKKSDLFEVLGV